MDRLSVAQAATVLGITQAAVYKRIQRGTITHDKDSEGRVFVYLDTSDVPFDKSMDEPNMTTDESMDGSKDKSNSTELISELRAHNEHLREEVEAWREEARRKDTIIMTMAQRIPELEPAREAPSETREDPPQAASEEQDGTSHPDDEGAQKPSWWRRFFGFV